MYSRSLRLVILCLTASLAMWAQTQGTIQGVVSDNSGAVIPGAAVSVTNVATGVTFDVTTNEAGFYIVPSINAGIYKVTVQVFPDAESGGGLPGMEFGNEKPPIPAKYGDPSQSDLKAVINEGENILDLQLTD